MYGVSKQRRAIEKELAEQEIYTSSMVYVEFKRTILQDIAFVLKSIEEAEPNQDALVRIADIDNWLSEKGGIYSIRRARRLLKVTSAIKAKFPKEESVKCSELAQFLRDQINIAARNLFFVFDSQGSKLNIQEQGHFINRTDCHLLSDEYIPGITYFSRLTCRRGQVKCSTRPLMTDNRDSVRSIEQAFISSEPESQDKKALEAISIAYQVLNQEQDTDKALGQSICFALGDVIIALECPDDVPLYSYDKHFGVICPAIERDVILLD